MIFGKRDEQAPFGKVSNVRGGGQKTHDILLSTLHVYDYAKQTYFTI
jgi:hypothetical protein